jgi:hypothetical protein
MRLLIGDKLQLWEYNHMIVFSKATITAAAFIVAVSASMLYATAHAENSIGATQSTEDGLEVDCEGNLNCEIIGDDTVVATS